MNHDRRPRRWGRGLFLRLAVLGTAAAAGTAAATNASAAAPALNAVVTAVTCATSTACVSGTNTAGGPGVSGTSAKYIGVIGIGKTGYGMRALSTSSDGILGSSTTGQAGVAGTTPSGYGVYGYTTGSGGGTGVYGTSASGYGVYGKTTTGDGYGLVGYETNSGTGVYGYSSAGYGSQALTSSGTALYAAAFGTGNAVNVSSTTGYGIIATSNGNVPVYARNGNGNGGDFTGTYIGLVGRSPASGYPLVLTDTSSNNLFYVDGSGNVSYKGGLFSFSPTRSGGTVKSFSAKTTLPTVEDTGTAQLAGGIAQVRLDATFAASIDPSVAYRVFVTPNGDTRGLYVATKTATGFVVREAQAGRSSVGFDYRIVATALGHARERMALTSTATTPQAPVPVVPVRQPVRPARLPAP